MRFLFVVAVASQVVIAAQKVAEALQDSDQSGAKERSPFVDAALKVANWFDPGVFAMVAIESMYALNKYVDLAISKSAQMADEQNRKQELVSELKYEKMELFVQQIPTAVSAKILYRYLNHRAVQSLVSTVNQSIGLPYPVERATVFASMVFLDTFQSLVEIPTAFRRVEDHALFHQAMSKYLEESGVNEPKTKQFLESLVVKLSGYKKSGKLAESFSFPPEINDDAKKELNRLADLYQRKTQGIDECWTSIGTQWAGIIPSEILKDSVFVAACDLSRWSLNATGIRAYSPSTATILEAIMSTSASTFPNNIIRQLVKDPQEFAKMTPSPTWQKVFGKSELTPDDQTFVKCFVLVLTGNPFETALTRIQINAGPRSVYGMWDARHEIADSAREFFSRVASNVGERRHEL